MARFTLFLLTLLAVLAAASTAQEDMFKYMNRIPKCAITCILQEVPQSACKTVTNTTCICSDQALREATQACLQRTCESTLDALEAAKVEAEACQRPYRDVRHKLFSSIPIQVITALAVLLRMYSRWEVSKAFESDDWIMVVCLAIYVPFSVMGTLTGQLAFGRDIWNVPPDNLTLALKLFYVSQMLYLLCLALSKIALLLFFLRIFPDRTFRRVTYSVILFTALSTSILILVQIFQCLPVSFTWEGWKGAYGPHRCVDINALAFAAAGFSIAQDIIILVLPLPSLLRLQVSPRTKAGIVLMFSLGIFILITSCIRLRFILIFAKSANPTWDYVDALIWSGTEISVSMIVVSLPAIRILLTRIVPGVFSTIASKTGWSFGGTQKSGTGRSSRQQRSQVGGEHKPGEMERDGDDDSDHQQQQQQQQQQETNADVDVEKAQHRHTHPRFLPLSKFNRLSLYNISAGRREDPNESEEALELGDRARGEAPTEGVSESGRSSTRGQNGSEDEEDDGVSSRESTDDHGRRKTAPAALPPS